MVQIREAVAEDAVAVARVHVRAWQVGYRGLVSQDYLDGLCPEARAVRYTFDRMTSEGPFTQVAVEGAEICGLVTTGRSRDPDLPDVGEVWAIYVDPPLWGSGVGRALMISGANSLRRNGFDEVSLWVLDGNVRARRFYELDGWHLDGARRVDVVGDTSVNEVRYRRRLG